jgi:hypothetical protein
MVLSFDTAYRHISQDGFLQRDGFIIYQDAKRHFVGHEAKDVIHHHQNIQKFSPSPRLSFRADAVKLDDLFRRVEEVTHQPVGCLPHSLPQRRAPRYCHPHPDNDADEGDIRYDV